MTYVVGEEEGVEDVSGSTKPCAGGGPMPGG